jgi:hypothetical protein
VDKKLANRQLRSATRTAAAPTRPWQPPSSLQRMLASKNARPSRWSMAKTASGTHSSRTSASVFSSAPPAKTRSTAGRECVRAETKIVRQVIQIIDNTKAPCFYIIEINF